MDLSPLDITLIVSACVVAYGAGVGATWGLYSDETRRSSGESDPFPVMGAVLWPIVLPGVLMFKLAMWLRRPRTNLPTAKVIERDGRP